jgi:prepilin-type N-terminal cleavage/methylation domain-containing protein
MMRTHSAAVPVMLVKASHVSPGRAPRQQGFTLIELAVVLVVIGLIIGAVSIGRDLQRNAVYQRIANDFVQGWAIAYDRYYDGTGHPPGDTPATPTGKVNAAIDTPLCGADLLAAMQAAGVEMPPGRAEGSADRYVYLDSNGVPHALQVCFENVNWSEPDATPGTYVVRPRNVMVLNSLTPALATLLDSGFDSLVDARFGRLREQSIAADVTTNLPANWSVDERMAYGSTTATTLDESQVAEVAGYFKMSR